MDSNMSDAGLGDMLLQLDKTTTDMDGEPRSETDVPTRVNELTAAHMELESTLPNSYTHRTAYMRFRRKMCGKKKPISAALLERFMADKDSLFVDYIDAGETVATMDLMEVQKKSWTDVNKSQSALKSRTDLLKVYRAEDDKADIKTVDEIIKRKWDAGLCEEDPDVPGNYQYYARDNNFCSITCEPP